MLKIKRVNINGTDRYYLFFFDSQPFLKCVHLTSNKETKNIETIGSSNFFLQKEKNTLCKAVTDKYPIFSFKWFFRDVISKRMIFQTDAIKEWRSSKIITSAGQQCVNLKFVAVAVNPLNEFGSLLGMEYLKDVSGGLAYFSSLSDNGKFDFLRRLVDELLLLARLGYYHRDLHFDNFMVSKDGGIIWIDTHIKKLPKPPHEKEKTLLNSTKKLHHKEEYREFIVGLIRKNLAMVLSYSIS